MTSLKTRNKIKIFIITSKNKVTENENIKQTKHS